MPTKQATRFAREYPGGSASANECFRALVRTSEAFVDATARSLRQHGLSVGARQTLAILDGEGLPLSPTTIAERLIVTTASMTSLLDTLERKGLVRREPDPLDRRRLLISITAAGSEAINRLLPEMVALQTAMATTLTETERAELLRLLAALRSGIDAVDGDAVVAAARPRRRA